MAKEFRSLFLLVFLLSLASLADAWPVPDTGQTKCYDNLGEIPCPQPGQPFYGQDGSYLINPPSYTKLDAQGNDLPDDAPSWVMVRDNVTGLIWEVKQNQDGMEDYANPHDADNTYTWYDSNPATNGGDAGTPGDGTDTEDFIAAINAANFGGYSDWRLPTRQEPRSLVDYDRFQPSIDTTYFPNTLPSYYWSSATDAGYIGLAWSMYFNDGYDQNSYKSSNCHARAVRGGQFGPSNQLIINGDGTVTDTDTGLMWEQKTDDDGPSDKDSFYTWEDALAWVASLNASSHLGYDDWRLPTVKELDSIVDPTQQEPGVDGEYFPNTQPSSYWSSTTCVTTTSHAWLVDFNLGYLHQPYNKSYYGSYVRAVRTAQSESSANDNFVNAIAITSSAGQTTGSNATATKESGEPDHAGNSGGKSVWWRWTAPTSGNVTIDTFGSGFNTLLAAYTGTAVGSLSLTASNDDAGDGTQSQISFNTVSGTEYKIAVDGFSGASGSIVLNWSLVSSNNLVISAPIDFEVPQDSVLSLPIILTNAEVAGIEGVDIALTYNPSVISAIGATLTGGILETQNYTMQANTGVSGQVSLAISANAGLFAGQGIIGYVNFQVVGNVNDVSSLTFTRAQINEADVSVQNGSVKVIPSTYDISGTVRFFATSNPVPNASLDLTGAGSRQANTNASGQFTITGVEPGNYTLTPSKSDDLGGLSATDASRIARHAVGLQSFSCMEKIAADVSRNGEISSVDASRVARYAVGLIDCLNDTTDCRNWVFVPQTISACAAWPPIAFDSTRAYAPLSADLTGQDFVAVRLGDVTGNWTPAAAAIAAAAPRAPMAMPLEVGCEQIVATDDNLTVPIVLEQEAAIEGLDIRVTFDESILDATGATLSGGILDGQNYSIQTNTGVAGQVSLAISASGNLFTGSGNVAFVTFTVTGDAGATDLAFSRFDVNEAPAAGRFRIGENLCPTVQISLGTASTTGTVTGKVTTELFGQSVDVVGATVRVVGTELLATTDEAGNYTLIDVPAGTHDLEVSIDQFQTLTVSGVAVNAGQTTPVSAESTVLSLAPECSAAQLEAVRAEEQQKWDANGDGKIGIEEAIRALRVLAGVE